MFVINIFQHFFHTWEGWGRVRGCRPMHNGLWGACVAIFWKMLNQKALAKRFSFMLHMNTWVNTYWKIYVSLRLHLKSVRSSSWLVCGYVIILAERHDGIKKCKWFCINAMVGLNFLLPVERLIFICSYKSSSNAEFLIIFMRLMVTLLHSVTNFLRNT